MATFSAHRPFTNEACTQQLERILRSSLFSGSPTLRQLLTFLAKKSLECPDQHVGAQDIAVEALGRHGTYDAQEDSSVRVHTGRLRAKLAEYYLGEGARDEIVLQIPKGGYKVTFRAREESPETSSPVDPADSARRSPILALAGSFFAGLVIAAAAAILWVHAGSPPSQPSIERFWKQFIGNGADTLLIYSNHRLVGDTRSGLRQPSGPPGPDEHIVDDLTGTSEVAAAFDLSRLFHGQLHERLFLHSSLVVTWDDAQRYNLILTGGTRGNPALKQMPGLREFAFINLEQENRPLVNALVNVHPAKGEQARYESPDTVPYPYDYAVVALVPGLTPGRKALILAGLGTPGTRAAVELVCSETRLRKLLDRLPQSGGTIPYFEAVIHVRALAGVPMEPRILIVRKRTD